MLKMKNVFKGSIISALALMLFATPVSAKQRVHHHRRVLMSIVIGGNQRHAVRHYNKARRPRRTHHVIRNRNTYKRPNEHLNRQQMIQLLNKAEADKRQAAAYDAKYDPSRSIYRSHQTAAKIYERTHRSTRYNHRDFRPTTSDLLAPRSKRVANKVTSQLDYWTLRDINKDRKAYHLWPLTETNQLNDLAKIRASQILTNFNHKDSRGITYDAKDSPQVGMNPLIGQFMVGENLMAVPLGYSAEEDDPTNYCSRNGHDLADEDENSMLNYDNDNNGHRKNILDATSRNIGIASRYDPKDKGFYLAEEFE